MVKVLVRSIFTIFVIVSVFTNAVIARTMTNSQPFLSHCLQMTESHSPALSSDDCCNNALAPVIIKNTVTCGTMISDSDHSAKSSSSCCGDDDCKTKQTQAALLTLFSFSAIAPERELFSNKVTSPVRYHESRLKPPLV
ncbi:hypothetical protein [Photobacterium leiognathi]|uniref:hypothetical protein n=1 Tax=Photobacterium leiognathi TaxID=553611 RepID=UPI002732767D|nr:hypothetical protein [Photobacterium leiognathi]